MTYFYILRVVLSCKLALIICYDHFSNVSLNWFSFSFTYALLQGLQVFFAISFLAFRFGFKIRLVT